MRQLAGSFYKRHAITLSGSDRLQVHGFRFSFTPLPGSFSPFPHGTMRYRSWRVVPPASGRIPRVPPYSGSRSMRARRLRLRGFHPLCRAFPDPSAVNGLSHRTGSPPERVLQPHAWHARVVWALPSSLAATGGISFDFSSCRYLDGSLPCVFPPCTMCSCIGWMSSRHPGYPIRTSRDRGILAPPPGFSQLVTSFFVWRLPGILRGP